VAIKVRARGGGGWVGGIITILFGLPFFGLGMTFFVMGIGSLFNPDLIEGDTMAKVMAAVIGGIFALVGGAVIWSGIRGIRGGRTSRPAGEVLAAGTGPNDWPMFPKARTCGRGPAGGELLKAHVTRAMALVGLTIVSIFWNGISWLAFWAVFFKEDDAPFWAKIMICVFCLIGLALVCGVIRQVLLMLSWAGTQVEVGKELLRPGESTRLRVYQRGDFAIDRLKLVVVAKETARYKVGTDTSVATEEIWLKAPCGRSQVGPWLRRCWKSPRRRCIPLTRGVTSLNGGFAWMWMRRGGWISTRSTRSAWLRRRRADATGQVEAP
jgi:hypothetical protein